MAKKSSLTSNHEPLPHEAAEGPVLVAFDFDGTLTIRDSFLEFLKWRAGKMGFALGVMRLGPAAFAYLGHRDRAKIKAATIGAFLKGVPRQQLEQDAKAFAEVTAPKLFRSDALVTWRRWRARGARLVIVTASPEILVAPFARGLGAEALIGTQIAFDHQDRVVGALEGKNCRGIEKVTRLKAMFGEDLHLAAAYGDTEGDREMLELAEERGYRVFEGKA